MKCFGTVRKQIFERKFVILTPSPLSLIHKIIPYQKFSERQKGYPSIFFGTVRQQIFDGKS